ILCEGVPAGIVTPGTDFGMNFVSKRTPAIHGTLEAEAFDVLDGAVERDPGHDLRVREMPAWSANLPDAFIGLTPDVLEPREQFELDAPVGRPVLLTVVATQMKTVEHLAEHVELELRMRGVADSD